MSQPLTEIGPRLPSIARRELQAFVVGQLWEGERLGAPAPVFVTLRAPGAVLRGCVGSTRAVMPTLTEETARSARLAASKDPRFDSVSAEELPLLRIEVSVLLPEEPIGSPDQLAPDRYGVIVRERGGWRQGLLLPGIVGIDDPDTQVALAKHKAGLGAQAAVDLSRFEVLKFDER